MQEHHFRIEDAIQYGVEKAILLYNLRFWLEKNKANERNIHEHEGKEYYWTFNSSTAYNLLFPYMAERSIRRWLLELEEDGIIISGKFNKHNYDQTKWYTMPEYVIALAKMADTLSENGRPIPDINTDKKQIYREDEKDECYEWFGFPLPEGHNINNMGFDSDSSNRPNVILTDQWGQVVKQSKINEFRKKYISSAKAQQTRKENKDSLESKMVMILKEVQNISHLDGVNNLDSAKTLKNALQEHLLAEFDLDTRNDTERFLREFRAILGHIQNKSPFHWKNATSIGYLTRNLNKIIRDIK
jgi:hypothetical protein